MKEKTKALIAYTYSHFCVDFVCFYILFFGVQGIIQDTNYVALGFLMYNIIAFGLQPIIGYYCDEHPKFPTAITGVTLVLVGAIIVEIPWVAMTIAALGNAFFHVGGGIDSIINAEGKVSRSGVFVSAGAVGVVLGTLYGNSEHSNQIFPMMLLVICILAIHTYSIKAKVTNVNEVSHVGTKTVNVDNDKTITSKTINANEEKTTATKMNIATSISIFPAIIMIMVAVVIRAYAGGMIPQEWKTTEILILVSGVAACIGKALGGYLADCFGAKNVGVFALLISIPFILLGRNQMILSAIGIILFNIPMPITLCALASRFPWNPGLAFGLTTLALLLGSLPVLVYQATGIVAMVILITLILLAALFIAVTTKNGEKA